MDWHALKEQIIEKSKELGIDKIGFTTADPFQEMKRRLIRQEENNYQSGFEHPNFNKRTTPTLLLDEAQSIISIAIAYPSKMNNSPKSQKGAYRGVFARASWGDDYHRVLQNRLTQLEQFIRIYVPNARIQSMVDTGELVDRAVAERAGIGWSAKNCSIITPEFGSYVYLGEMITNIPFPPDTPIEDECGECRLCIDNCPTGAIVEAGVLDAKRCISFVTQTRGFVPDEFRELIGNRLYGCDTCQTICPKNRKKDFHFHSEFEPEPEKVKPLLKPLLKMDEREFQETFGHMSGAWRGRKPIQRNALIALAHFKDTSAIPEIHDVLSSDPRPVLRGTAAWALGKIGGQDARKYLLEAKEIEKDPEVLFEIEKGLQYFSNVEDENE